MKTVTFSELVETLQALPNKTGIYTEMSRWPLTKSLQRVGGPALEERAAASAAALPAIRTHTRP